MFRNLSGAFDFHIHTKPDVKARKLDDIAYVKKCMDAGMSGVLFKNHMAPTAVRAGIIRLIFPSFDANGGIVLNPSVGGLNPAAVETAAKMGGRVVWFPTLFAKDYIDFKKTTNPAAIDVLTEDGELCAEAAEVIAIAAKYDMVVATGHLAEERAVKVAREAFHQNVKKVLFTHINHPNSVLSGETKLTFQNMGAFFELSYHPILSNMATLEQAVEDIRFIGAEHIILSTDLGQPELPDPVEGLSEFLDKLFALGITKKELEQMTVINPKQLLATDN